MKSITQPHHRRSIRLHEFDYSQPGAYFITVVAHDRAFLFGEVVDGKMRLNEYGKIIEAAWFDLPHYFLNVELGAFCLMPNHIHAVIILMDQQNGMAVGAGLRPAPTPLSEIVRAFKSFSARRINEIRNTIGVPVWQRNYYEHIIRNHLEHRDIHLYIEANPANWADDDENPAKIAG